VAQGQIYFESPELPLRDAHASLVALPLPDRASANQRARFLPRGGGEIRPYNKEDHRRLHLLRRKRKADILQSFAGEQSVGAYYPEGVGQVERGL
jgi:hypothetical protein